MAGEGRVFHPAGGESLTSLRIDRLITDLAQRQYGVVALWQLHRAGISDRAVEHRIRHGLLHRIHRGVYAVGHLRLTPDGYRMAAALRVGPDASLTHRSAAEVLELPTGGASRFEVTCPRRVAAGARIVTYRRFLPADELTVQDGIPITTVARTLFDLAATVPEHRFLRALHEAHRRELGEGTPLAALLDRYRGHRGTAAVRRGLAQLRRGGPLHIRSDLEALFVAFVAERGLPRPQANVAIAGTPHVVDFAWPRQRVIVEVDSYEYHGDRQSFAADRVRDRELRVRRWEPIRVSADDLETGRDRLHAHLVALLGD